MTPTTAPDPGRVAMVLDQVVALADDFATDFLMVMDQAKSYPELQRALAGTLLEFFAEGFTVVTGE